MDEKYILVAQGFAEGIHKDQKRKFGTKEAYINHPRRVSERCIDKVSKCIAWLHDTVEDAPNSDETLKTLTEAFPSCVVDGVITLTRQEDENYADYILRVSKAPPVVLAVKLADLEDNMSDLKEGSLKDKYRLAHYIIYIELENRWNINELLKPIEETDNVEKG